MPNHTTRRVLVTGADTASIQLVKGKDTDYSEGRLVDDAVDIYDTLLYTLPRETFDRLARLFAEIRR